MQVDDRQASALETVAWRQREAARMSSVLFVQMAHVLVGCRSRWLDSVDSERVHLLFWPCLVVLVLCGWSIRRGLRVPDNPLRSPRPLPRRLALFMGCTWVMTGALRSTNEPLLDVAFGVLMLGVALSIRRSGTRVLGHPGHPGSDTVASA